MAVGVVSGATRGPAAAAGRAKPGTSSLRGPMAAGAASVATRGPAARRAKAASGAVHRGLTAARAVSVATRGRAVAARHRDLRESLRVARPTAGLSGPAGPRRLSR